jgi:hypothetical protein
MHVDHATDDRDTAISALVSLGNAANMMGTAERATKT